MTNIDLALICFTPLAFTFISGFSYAWLQDLGAAKLFGAILTFALWGVYLLVRP